jgi:phosphodiesterase/alkaline phosphatase D-like protein/2',3'-cyclic-nucleotide 2'-phosphodiesterase (5'-nucleotidase family)
MKFKPLLFLLVTSPLAGAVGNATFPQSVASGDPQDDSIILWTRVDGLAADATVTLKISATGSTALVGTATELTGTNLWTSGPVPALAAHDGVVKLAATGLQPDTTYYYQFTYNGTRSPIGRTKTAPAAGATRAVRYAAINCNDYVGRYFNVLKHLCDQEADKLDFVLNLGDYIYETTGDPGFQTTSPGRLITFTNPGEAIALGSAGGATFYAANSVGNYRDIYKTIRQDPQLQRLHELFPMVSIWDDHEFSDDHWRDHATYFDGLTDEQQTQRKRNAETAWMEFLPSGHGLNSGATALEIDAGDLFPNLVLNGTLNFGTNLDLILTDNRTNRPDHLIPEDAFPATVALDENTTIATLAAAYGLDFATTQTTVWPTAKAVFDAYINIDDAAYAGPTGLKAVLQGIVAAGIGGPAGAAYTAKVTGNLGVLFINAMLESAGEAYAGYKITDTAALPRGISFYLLGKQSFFTDFGSRYQVVDQTYALYAGATYQMWLASGGAAGRDQAFYTPAQVTALGSALASSSAAGHAWRVVASSAPYTPLKVNYGAPDLPATLPNLGTFGGSPLPASAIGKSDFIPAELKVPFLLNADEVSGFPNFKQGIVDLLAAHDAVIVSGDIHASMIGQLTGASGAGTGRKVIDFTVPSASSGEFRKAFDSAFALVESLTTHSLRKALNNPTATFAMDPAQKQSLIDASDAIIKHGTPEMLSVNTKAHGYTVFQADSATLTAEYRTINTGEIATNHYATPAAALDQLFARERTAVTRHAGGLAAAEVDQFKLQILHASDMEADASSVAAAPLFAALVDRLEDNAAADASVTIAAGDCFIPGAFLSAGNDPTTKNALKSALGFAFGFDASGTQTDLRESAGRPDIAIMNAIGFDATCIGNHEFDLGATEFGSIVLPDIRAGGLPRLRHYGAAFPFLSANLDFSGDAALNARYTSELREVEAFRPNPATNFAGLDATPTKAKLAKAAIINRGGGKIGVLGVSPPDLANISSPGLVTVTGPQGATVVSPRTYDIVALAAHLQPTVDALKAAGCNKIILATQLQQIDNEKALAEELDGVDVIIAGGSGTIYANDPANLHPGDTAAGTYPYLTTDKMGKTVAIVSNEGQYQYLGQLVVTFNAAGEVISASGDNLATTTARVAGEWGAADPYAAGTRAGTVKTVTDAVGAIINAKDGLILGKTAVYLEGRRTAVRQQESNFGNLSADANLWYAQQVDPAVEVSLKNGGGIRNAIGSIDPSGNLLPPAANPSAGKLAGDISRLDLEDSLKFNNNLTLVTVTAAQLKVLLEHGVAGSNGTGADKNTPGQFCQLGGLMVVADLAETPVSYASAANVISAVNGGTRIRYAALVDSTGTPTEVLVSNGIVLNPGRQIRLVTLNFLVNPGTTGSDFGGDSYPFPWAIRNNAAANRLDLTTDGSANGYKLSASLLGGVAEGAGTEQDAFAEYLLAFHATAAFNTADTMVGLDRRIIQGTTDSDGDGFSNALEVAALGLNPDQANTASQINAALAGIRTAGRADVVANPAAYSLYTAASIQDLRGTGNLLVQAAGAQVTLSLPLQKSTNLDTWESAGTLEATLPKTEDKEFYRLVLPE